MAGLKYAELTEVIIWCNLTTWCEKMNPGHKGDEEVASRPETLEEKKRIIEEALSRARAMIEAKEVRHGHQGDERAQRSVAHSDREQTSKVESAK